MSTTPRVPRLRVAFFQRIFAHYQAGLVRELGQNSEHEYHFFGDDHDPLGSGIEPIPAGLCTQVTHTVCRTVHWGECLAFQWRAVYEALFGDFEAYILEGSFTIPTNWLAIPAARIRGKRVLLYSHGWLRRESGCKAWLRRCFYRLADGLLLYGNRAKEIGEANGFSHEKLYVAYNSLDDVSIHHWQERITPPLCDEFRREWFGPDSGRPLITGVGRLTEAKKYTMLLHAVNLLGRQGSPLNILLVGDGPERNMLEQKAKKMDVRLVCTGSRYDEEFLSVCFSAADITVIPGAAGLTVIHSLSYGTPVVVHDDADRQMPESEAVEAGVSGELFHSENAEDLARSILMVLQNMPRSPRVADQCRSVVDAAYTPSKMRIVFDDAVNGHPAK